MFYLGSELRIFQTAGALRYLIRCTVRHMLPISVPRRTQVADITYQMFTVSSWRLQRFCCTSEAFVGMGGGVSRASEMQSLPG